MKISKCPFCGGEDADVDYADLGCYYVVCSCGAMGGDKEIEEEAIGVWNIVSEKVYG